jgi:RNA polymerase sigma-70 factor (ECF subfamily)
VTDLDVHLSQIMAGDAKAFGVWMATAEPILRDNLRRFSAHVDTEAILQETLLRVWQVAPDFKPDGRPNGLLRLGFIVSKNLAISERRKVKSSPQEPLQIAETLATIDVGEVRPPDPILRKVIQFCRERLPKKPAEVLTARLLAAGSEPDEVLAERLAMKKNTFLQNFTRARKFLLECLKKQGVDLEVELAR